MLATWFSKGSQCDFVPRMKMKDEGIEKNSKKELHRREILETFSQHQIGPLLSLKSKPPA
jgi:hypothetical protein